ncbi:MAG: type II secretion system F family protein [Polaromonas sp.]|uniref:type II secretion system F family protein n=1 Tax=Polaromonas sp. TaxID=1869339 RepID=UPI00248A8936|nr:type II secretion system F family protein [Polaromonas sp.]MDI1270124.1 type II secretion system F family protein [Polaromonas sp.]
MNLKIALPVLLFFCTFVALYAAYLLWQETRSRRAQRFMSRLEQGAAQADLSQPQFLRRGQTRKALLEGLIRRNSWAGKLDALRNQAGLHLASGTLTQFTLIGAALGEAILWLSGLRGWFLGLAWLVAMSMPLGWLFWLRARRCQAIERQLPGALDGMIRSLQVGQALSSVWGALAHELPMPLQEEFYRVHEQLQFGESIDRALENLASRSPSADLKFFVTALRIQHQSGGNLVQLLGDQASLLRERQELRGKIHALSSEARLSAWILGVLPFIVAGGMLILSPGQLSLLWNTPSGLTLLKIGVALQAAGIFWLWRLVQPDARA